MAAPRTRATTTKSVRKRNSKKKATSASNKTNSVTLTYDNDGRLTISSKPGSTVVKSADGKTFTVDGGGKLTLTDCTCVNSSGCIVPTPGINVG